MGLIKYLFEIVLITMICFFVWNILKRIFFNSFYKNFPRNQAPQNENRTKKDIGNKVHWDAETVDYEEVKEDKKDGKP